MKGTGVRRVVKWTAVKEWIERNIGVEVGGM